MQSFVRPISNTLRTFLFEIHILLVKGRGVFAKQDFTRDSVLERVPLIEIPGEDWQVIQKTCLHNYAFGWGPEQDQAGIALGWGSLFNHSYLPNAFYRKIIQEQRIEFIACGIFGRERK